MYSNSVQSIKLPSETVAWKSHRGILIKCCFIRHQKFEPTKKYAFVFKPATNNDFNGIGFQQCEMDTVPVTFSWIQLWQSLKYVEISNSNLKTICANDLKGLHNLFEINLNYNHLQHLPGDLFTELYKLRKVSIEGNSIKYIDAEILFSFTRLDHLNLKNNININRFYEKNNPSTTTLQVIKQDVLLKCQRRYDEENEEKPCETIKPIADEAAEMSALLQNEKAKDFTVVVEDQVFKVHRFVLMATSTFFRELIAENPKLTKLQLFDIPANIFQCILNNFYDNTLPPPDTNWSSLFAASEELEIDDIKEYAANKLMDQMNEENVFELCLLSNKYNHKEMRDKAYEIIKNMFPDKELNDEFSTDSEIIQLLREVKKKQNLLNKCDNVVAKLQNLKKD